MSVDLVAVQAYHTNGLSILPAICDGTKAPALPKKNPVLMRERRATAKEIADWFTDKEVGVIVQCGKASGNLLVFDIEYADIYQEFVVLIEVVCPGLLATLPHVRTPGRTEAGGLHLYLRTATPLPGQKIARTTPEDAVVRTGGAKSTLIVETRGDGQYVIAPGSDIGVHASGRPYLHISGPCIWDAPILEAETVEALLSCARSLDRQPLKETSEGPRVYCGRGTASGNKPGVAFNDQADWKEILPCYGWTLVRQTGGRCCWRRPGKTTPGISATTGFCSSKTSGDLLYVFTTNGEPLESDRAYSKFAVFAIHECAGDFAIAARELGQKGYGDPPQLKPLPPVDSSEIAKVEKPDAEDRLEFPIEVFPPTLAEFATQVARSMSCPVDFPALSMMAVAGAAIGASRALAVHKRWSECPRFYIALVAEPGGSKTPAVSLVTTPVTELQNKWHREYAEAKVEYEEKLSYYEAGKKAHAAGKKGADITEKPQRPVYKHLYTTEPTVESIAPILSDCPRGLLYYKDELTAWVLSMNQYKGGKGADRQFYLSAWSGEPTKIDRKSNHTDGPLLVPRPFVNVLGGIQPDMLSILMDEEGREDGFVHRILFGFPTERPWPENVGIAPDDRVVEAWNDVITDLLFQFHMEEDDNGVLKPLVLQMNVEARSVWHAWFAEHAKEHNDHDFPPSLKGPWAKMKSYFVRTMLLLHCLRLASGEEVGRDVDGQSAIAATKIMVYFKTHCKLVQGRLHQDKDAAKAVRIVQWIDRHNGVATIRDLQRAHLVSKATEAKELLGDLADRGFGTLKQEEKVWTFRRHEPVA